MSDFIVVQTHPQLIQFVDSLQKKNAEALSFYPRQVFERESDRGRIFLGLLNGEPCGYLYVGAQGQDVKCHQVCIEYDARRRLYGAAIVAVMEHYALEKFAYTISLRCGFDLDANAFWKSLGYQCVANVPGGVRRMRTINIWRKQLTPELFDPIEIDAAVGKTSSSLWAKNKDTGLITQFMRGKALQDYRALLISKDEGQKE
jgi:hypothetical protein